MAMTYPRKCEVCGKEDIRVCGKSGKYRMDLCTRHYLQMQNNGKILERTGSSPNEFMVKGDITEIVLYDYKRKESGRGIIDTKDYDRVSKRKWHITSDGYIASNVHGRQRGLIKLHRFITNAPKGMVVDHINHNVADNRNVNLRVCTAHDNSRNMILSSNNTSGYTGVFWNKKANKWCARIMVDYKSIHLGFYTDIADAIVARKQAEIKYFGEFRYVEDIV